MNVCKMTSGELYNLNMIIKQYLRSRKMHGDQCSDERLYLPRSRGGRGLRSFKDIYYETKLRVACYMTMSTSKYIKVAWEREKNKEFWSLLKEACTGMEEVGHCIEFLENTMIVDSEAIEGDWKSV